MDRPKRIAKSMTGKNASTGLVPLSPMMEPPSPHWNTATRMPNAAPMESRFMQAAVSGMRSERNTIINKRNESSTTKPMKSGNFELRTLAKSMKIAVFPPTSRLSPEWPDRRRDEELSAAQVVDQVGGRRVLRRRGREDVHQHDVAAAGLARDVGGHRRRRHARLPGDVRCHLVDHRVLVGLDHADHHEGTRVPGSESRWRKTCRKRPGSVCPPGRCPDRPNRAGARRTV